MNSRASPVLLQVAALAVVAVVATQIVTLAIIMLAPQPQIAGFTFDAAASALKGHASKTRDGRTLQRRVGDEAPFEQEHHPFADAVARSLARELGRDVTDVRVRVEPPQRLFDARRPPKFKPPAPVRVTPGPPPGPPPGRFFDPMHVGALSDEVYFPPFSATVHLANGQWATIVPPRGWLAPWQRAVLLSMVVSLVLLTPLIWWMSNRLARPIRRFASAANRLGADPDAAPLTPNGPREVRQAIAAFNDMQARLKEHIERRTHTVAAIAHDLRTPLTRLRFRVEAMPEAQQKQAIEDIDEMDALIAQAMQFVKGQFDIGHAEVLDFSNLVSSMAARYEDTDATIVMNVEDGLSVLADASAMRRALSNLIDNAIVHAKAVSVQLRAENGYAVVSVRDNGPGIPEDQLERVFDPFFRLDGSRNRKTGGAGLGLPISRHAVRAHGGDLTLSNAEGGGVLARLSLPLLADALSDSSSESTPAKD